MKNIIILCLLNLLFLFSRCVSGSNLSKHIMADTVPALPALTLPLKLEKLTLTDSVQVFYYAPRDTMPPKIYFTRNLKTFFEGATRLGRYVIWITDSEGKLDIQTVYVSYL